MTYDIGVVTHDLYEKWVFSSTHPTQGRRFVNGVNEIKRLAKRNGQKVFVGCAGEMPRQMLETVHDPLYVTTVLDDGICGEWDGQRQDLGKIAAHMAGGTYTAFEMLDHDKDTLVAVNLAGAKHHAQKAYSSGFCVFNDFAIVAHEAVARGKRVAILDFDAHHGDGTETLTYHEKDILTYSIHEQGIFPNTGYFDDIEFNVFNRPLESWSGDRQLLDHVRHFTQVAKEFMPDYIFITAGSDGHVEDPLSTLRYTLDGYTAAAHILRSAFPSMPMLVGGAGGYQPDDFTPMVWARFATELIP